MTTTSRPNGKPGCLLAIASTQVTAGFREDRGLLLDAVRNGRWTGRASQLSEDHVQWTFIDQIARAPRRIPAVRLQPVQPSSPSSPSRPSARPPSSQSAREVIVRRRSAVAFDGRSSIDVDRFILMMTRVLPDLTRHGMRVVDAPDHLVVPHRVDGLEPGLYFLP